MKLYICLIPMFLGVAAGLHCILVPGWLKQIDAGAGEVYGVTDGNTIYKLNVNKWDNIPGKLIHVSVGPSGIWGASEKNEIFKMQDGNWVQVAGGLKQVDAGGSVLVGVSHKDDIFCLDQDATSSKCTQLPFHQLEGALKYYSCGLYGCWGVSMKNEIFHRLNVSPTNCRGSEWRQVEGNMIMVEVSTDGAVYGINTVGSIYKREGICTSNSIGTAWSLVNVCGPFKHLSYDEGILWLINRDGNIFKCVESYTKSLDENAACQS